jgi:asparagine synthase (glutamine-hydrolysing)
MCGIFSLLNNTSHLLTTQFIKEQFEKGRGRGPENSIYKNVMIKADFGFHRLAINGLNNASNQPIVIDDIALICNGEIYNYKELFNEMNVTPKTNSDCEVILHLYKKYGIEQTLQMLDGVFAFILIDYRLHLPSSKMYVARDPYGVRPLYFLKQDEKQLNVTYDPFEPQKTDSYYDFNIDSDIFGFASELKMLYEIKNKLNEYVKSKRNLKRNLPYYKIKQFLPGTYSVLELKHTVSSSWALLKNQFPYHSTGFHTNIIAPWLRDDEAKIMKTITKNIQYYLKQAVEKRCSTTERPIACLLSGGLDSSLIAALVNDYHVRNNLPTIETYSIGLAGSEDLKYARIVADYLGTNHTEILLTEQNFLDSIPQVIYDIESYDTTTVRASIGNWLLGRYISENSEAKVIFNGDGSDELAGGYLYMNCAPDQIEFDKECRRLLKDIYAFDVLRSDKSISSHGLEPRTPFLDRTWVQFYMSIPSKFRFHKISGTMEKSLIRNAFSEEEYSNSKGTALLPSEVLFRRKEAFSDGVSRNSRSLYKIIQEYCDAKFRDEDMVKYSFISDRPDKFELIIESDESMAGVGDHLFPQTAEQYYYRKIFESHYSGMGKILPYFWMPKYVDAKDASARTLDIYKGNQGSSMALAT